MSWLTLNDLFTRHRISKRVTPLCTITIFAAILAPPGAAHGESPLVLRRWAILSSKNIQEAGISDMLTADLSKLNGLQLVERDQLALTLSELELATLMGSQNPAGRLKFGRQLKADALLFVKLEQHEQRRLLHVVVSDTHYGARLLSDFLPVETSRPDKAVATLKERVQDVQRRFGAGIKQIIGVSRFISDNLPIKYDHLQAAYARLLESALLKLPGVAVIEIEEARAIGRELNLTGGEIRDRVVPVFVDGKFQAHERDHRSPLDISFTIDLKSAQGVIRTLQSARSGEAEAVRWLSSDVPAEITNVVGARQPLDLKQQAAILVARSDAFEDLGDFSYAAELREAALLAVPDDPEQELALIGLCFRKLTPFGVPGAYTESRRQAINEYYRQQQKSPDRTLGAWRHVADRVERVVGERVMNPREAAVLVHATLDTFRTHVNPQRVHEYDPAREFIARAYPLLRQLDPGIAQGRIRKSVSRAFPYVTLMFYKNSVGLQSFENPHSAAEQYGEWTSQGGRHSQSRLVDPRDASHISVVWFPRRSRPH